MSTTSDQHSPAVHRAAGQRPTQEIPVVAPGPVTGPAPEPPHTPAGSGAGGASGRPDSPEPHQASAPARDRTIGRRPEGRRAAIGLGLAALAVVLLEAGLLLRFGAESFWSAVTLWSAFATLSGVLALLAFAAFYPPANRLRSSAMWRIAAAGLVGLSVFWVLVVLPVVATDRGFVLTAALGSLGAALWIGPRRKD